MHALRKYLQDGLDARSWQQADLMRASGLSRQRVSQMLSDDRDVLPAVPRRETLQAIARAFNVRESTVTAVAFEAMGYDLAAVRREADLSTATDGQLVRALADRLGVGLDSKDGEGDGNAAPNTQAGNARNQDRATRTDSDSVTGRESVTGGEREDTHASDAPADVTAGVVLDPEELGLAARHIGQPNLGQRIEDEDQQRE